MNNKNINIKENAFCYKCAYFIKVKSIFMYNDDVFVTYKCNCSNFESKKELQVLIDNYINKPTTNSYITICGFSMAKIKKTLNISLIRSEYFCKCKEIPIKYCVECKTFLCSQCITQHYFHQKFNYNHKEFLNKKNYHKLEKYGYQSYITLKKCNSTVKSFLMKKTDKTNHNIKLLIDYIEYNEHINDCLYTLFKLLMNNFKLFPNITNYINLSYFSYFNLPFDFNSYFNDEVVCNSKLIKSYINYCQSNFLIPIQSDNKYFTLIQQYNTKFKEYYINHNKISESIFDYDTIKICDSSTITENRFHRQTCTRISFDGYVDNYVLYYETSEYKRLVNKDKDCISRPIMILKDNRLLLRFNNDPSLYIYSMNSNYKLKTSPDFMIYFFEEINQVVEMYDGRLIIIDYTGKTFEITLFSKSYKIKVLNGGNNFCLQTKSEELLFLNQEQLVFCINGKKRVRVRSYNDFLRDLKNAYQMKNKCILLNDDSLLLVYYKGSHFIIHNELFKGVRAIYENNKDNLIYYQTNTHLLIISSKTFQIQTIIERKEFIFFRFLKTPFENKNELKKFVEKINFSPKTFQEKLGHKVDYIIQISLTTFIATYRDTIFLYKI